MFLLTAATDFEMEPFLAACRLAGVEHLLTGIGPLETAVNLLPRVNRDRDKLRGVINFGVAGGYYQAAGSDSPDLLDICLASEEVLGDLGICLADSIERLHGRGLRAPHTFSLDPVLLERAAGALRRHNIPFHCGTFVTVSGASGTAARGRMLARQYNGLCENMEGAAVARVCRQAELPCLEIRCISNMVEDRDRTRWQLQKACRRAGEVTALVLAHLLDAERTPAGKV